MKDFKDKTGVVKRVNRYDVEVDRKVLPAMSPNSLKIVEDDKAMKGEQHE